MDELFHVSERKSTIGTELRAGLTTFLAMAYIIAVNPAVLSGAGIDAGALACATCLGAGIMTICMGIFANRPLACASGLGINAMIAGITTTMCGGDWHVAMSVIFLEGIVILLSSFAACARPSWTPSPWSCATPSRWVWACLSP